MVLLIIVNFIRCWIGFDNIMTEMFVIPWFVVWSETFANENVRHLVWVRRDEDKGLKSFCYLFFCLFPDSLKHEHYSGIYKKVDMSAEVAVLTHNIRIQGEVAEGSHHGGHVKVRETLSYINVECAWMVYFYYKVIKAILTVVKWKT